MVFTVPSSDALAAGDAATGAAGAWAWAADAKPVAPARERKTPRQNAILSETELFRVAIRILYWIWTLPPGMLSPPDKALEPRTLNPRSIGKQSWAYLRIRACYAKVSQKRNIPAFPQAPLKRS
jgi:hypothetical protein